MIFITKRTGRASLRVGAADEAIHRIGVKGILIADEDFRVGERGSEDEKCIAFFTASPHYRTL
jgi:hypothetical protein